MQIFGTAVLVAWDVPFGLHVAAYLMASCDGPLSAIYLSWANILTAHDSQVRALTLAFMNAFGNAVTLLIQQFLYPVTTAPKFHKGFSASLGFLIGMVCWAFFVRVCEMYTIKHGAKKDIVFTGLDGEPQSSIEGDSEGKGVAVDTNAVSTPTSVTGAAGEKHV